MPERIKKTYRFTQTTQQLIDELKNIYNIESENMLLETVIKDIHDVKKAKALVPFEELKAEQKELKQLYFEVGRLKGIIEEKDKELANLKSQLEKPHKSFWARLFGR